MAPLHPRQRAVLAIVLVSYLLIVVDVSIVITGLPSIRAGLGFSRTALSWVQNAYTLAFGGLLLLGARAGDLYGRRRMFLLGVGLFTLASVGVGVAASPAMLLAARALQGVGAAALAPSTLALLSTEFDEGPQRTHAVGLYAAAAGIGGSLGLVLGGFFADLLSWRAGFFINLPIGLALAWAARRHLQETPGHAGELDALSAIASTLGMGALVFGLVHAAEHGWATTLAAVPIGAGLAALALLVWNEARVEHPILPLRLFADRERAGAYAARVLFLGGMGGFWFFTTQLLQGVLGLRPALAGLAFLATTLPNFLVALAVPKLSRRFGNTRLLVAGVAIAVIGTALLSQADAHGSYLTGVALPMVLIGVGQGASLAPLTVAGMARVSPRDAGAGSGVINAAHQLGLSLGLAILVVVFANAGGALAHQIGVALKGTTTLLALACLVIVASTAGERRLPGP